MPSTSSSSHPDIPPFPSPLTFSLLPDIYILIARLNLLHQQAQTNGHSQQTAPSSQSQSQPQPSQISSVILNGAPLLDPKDLPSQIYPLKQRLVKARAAVTELPDVERTVEEQEVEIRRLTAMVKGLRARLGLLGRLHRSRREREREGMCR